MVGERYRYLKPRGGASKLLFKVATSFSVNYDLEAAGGTSFSGDLGFGNRIGSRAALLKKFLSGLRVGNVAHKRGQETCGQGDKNAGEGRAKGGEWVGSGLETSPVPRMAGRHAVT